jgi:drug/metabolite transporter (DMT)-like permease
VDELAAVLALLAAVSFALAATLWQKAALSLTSVSVRRPKSLLVLLTRWVWFLGLVAQLVGVALQAAALDRGRVSIIQPLLVTTVIWALPLGYFLTHQAIGGRGSLSTRAALLGTIAGLLYGLSATLMKPVVEGVHADGLADVVAGWEFWVWAAAGIVGFFVQQLSLSTGRLVPSVATVSVANPVVSVLLGALVLQERLDKTPPWHAVVAVGALCLALLGAVVISSAREQPNEAEQGVPEAEPAPAQPSLG